MYSRTTFALALGLALLSASASAQTSPVTIRFDARVGSQTFSCGQKYQGIGTTASTVSLTDFRFYVSNLRLITTTGAEVPVALEQDGLWQHENVALLDFEDASGSCVNGTPELRNVVEGTVPSGAYTGVRFDLGVPFELNHREATVAPSPLNLTRMFWSWNAGYKFARIDLRTTGQPQGWMIHLGSTGCSPSDSPSTVPVSCRHANRAAVDLQTFRYDRDVIQFDLAALLSDTNVDTNQEKTARGCMSGRDDEDCTPLLRALGLTEGQPAQRVFTVRPGTPASAGPRQ